MAEELADIQNNENAARMAETPVTDRPVIGKVPETPEKPDRPQSVRESLNAAVKSVAKSEAAAKRQRDEVGKFAPGERPVEAAPEIPKPKEDAQPEAPKVIGPPPGWSAESKAYFNSLPPDHPLRKDVAKREDEVSSGFKKYSETDKKYQEIEQVLAPARQVYQKAGVQSDAEAIKRLFAWEAQIRSNPTQALADLARQYGVSLTPNPSEPSTAQDIPPALKPVLDQFGGISQEVTSLKGVIESMQQDRVSTAIQAFATDPKHPHFEKVRIPMGQLMQAGIVGPNDLEGAYQKAVLLDPELSAQIAADKAAKDEAERTKQAQERARNASKAAVSPSGRAPAAPLVNGSAKAPGVRGSILQAIGELSGERA